MGRNTQSFIPVRFKVACFILILLLIVVLLRLFYLATFDRDFLLNRSQQQAEHPRVIPASRGVIFDRNGVALAVSAPIDSIIFNARVLSKHPAAWKKLADNPNLGLSYLRIERLLARNPKSQYIIAKKNLPPDVADAVDEMNIPGVYIQRNQQSYYPEGPALGQLVGFTNVKDEGQSGLELSYNHYLKPTYGKQAVTESALGQIYSINHLIKEAKDGHDLYLSVDSRLQYVAYQALASQVDKIGAEWGAAVVMNPHNGEVLAAVSYPSYNPNSVTDRVGENVKNRAITAQVEPGSTMKPVTISAALLSGKYVPTDKVDTNPGYYFLDGHKIADDSNNGVLTLTGIITRSSNVGVSKVGLTLNRQMLYNMFGDYGFTHKPSGGKFPGEAAGFMYPLKRLGDFQFATMMFGYSISASVLQLARMYSVFANGGILYPTTYVKLKEPPEGKRIVSKKIANQMMMMLKTVVAPKGGGTGLFANIPGYVVAGKTGTSQVLTPGGYSTTRHNAFFVGVVPANNPKLVIAIVMINPPGYWQGFGAIGAAPVFAKIALAAMHILGIPPSNDKINLDIFKHQRRYYKQLIEA